MRGVTVDVAWTADQVDASFVRGGAAVVIDVLRATTTIAALLEAGARAVWPVTEVDGARSLADQLGGALLAGERDGLPPTGFDMGNSPLDAVPQKVSGRDVVLTTTNGTRAIERCGEAKSLITAAFVNAGSAACWMERQGVERIYIVCAGTRGKFSLDDALCAGLLVLRISERRSCELTDAALAARTLFERFQTKPALGVAASHHAGALEALGLSEDVDYATQLDLLQVLPLREQVAGRIRIVRGDGSM